MKKRIEYLDIAKGILMCLIVVGHIITMNYPVSSFVKSFIYSFHVPAFFIISGLLMTDTMIEKYNFITFLIKKFKALMIPYFVFEVIAAVLQMIILGTEYINIKGAIIAMVFFYCNGGATWFLVTLFIAEVIIYLLLKLNKKCGKFLVFSIIVFMLLVAMILPKTHLYIVISRCLCGTGFIWIGMFIIKQILPKAQKLIPDWILCLASLALTIVVTLLNGKVGMNLCEYNNPVLYILGSIFGTNFVLLISQKIHSKILLYIGKYSLVIMGTHLNIIAIIEKYFQVDELLFYLWVPILLIVILFELFFVQIYRLINERNRRVCELENEPTGR